VADGGEDRFVDDRVAQFVISVAKLCADAHVGGLTVRLRLVTGGQVVGVPEPPPETQGASELDDTGYVDTVKVDGVAVALSDVIEACIQRAPQG
jgi:hypothetical protein